MEVSVIVVTYNRAGMLEHCLRSLLEEQERLPDELIVVNGGNDNTGELVARYQSRYPFVKLVNIKNISISNSRNVGVRAATKPVIAFTDDDCRADKKWVKVISEYHGEHPEVGALGGRPVNGCPDNLLARLGQKILTRGLEAGPVKWLPTNNASFKKKLVEEVGYFDESLITWEDVDLCRRIGQAGYQVYCHPELKITHYHRTTLGGFSRQHFNHGRGLYQAYRKWGIGTRIPTNVIGMGVFLGLFLFRPLREIWEIKPFKDKFLSYPVLILKEMAYSYGILYEMWQKRKGGLVTSSPNRQSVVPPKGL